MCVVCFGETRHYLPLNIPHIPERAGMSWRTKGCRSPLVIRNFCTRWVTVRCWIHHKISSVEWSIYLNYVSPYHRSPIAPGKSLDNGITSYDPMGAGILDIPGWDDGPAWAIFVFTNVNTTNIIGSSTSIKGWSTIIDINHNALLINIYLLILTMGSIGS